MRPVIGLNSSYENGEKKCEIEPGLGPVNAPITMNVKVTHGLNQYEVALPSDSTFGNLKYQIAQKIGSKPELHKLLFRGKEKEDDENLQTAGVKENSKVLLIDDMKCEEKICEEVKETSEISKGEAAVAEVRVEVDMLSEKVYSLKAAVDSGTKVANKDIMYLTEMLMRQLLKLDGIEAEGEGKVQRKLQVRRVQSLVETMDILKSRDSKTIGTTDKESVSTPWETFEPGSGNAIVPPPSSVPQSAPPSTTSVPQSAPDSTTSIPQSASPSTTSMPQSAPPSTASFPQCAPPSATSFPKSTSPSTSSLPQSTPPSTASFPQSPPPSTHLQQLSSPSSPALYSNSYPVFHPPSNPYPVSHLHANPYPMSHLHSNPYTMPYSSNYPEPYNSNYYPEPYSTYYPAPHSMNYPEPYSAPYPVPYSSPYAHPSPLQYSASYPMQYSTPTPAAPVPYPHPYTAPQSAPPPAVSYPSVTHSDPFHLPSSSKNVSQNWEHFD